MPTRTVSDTSPLYYLHRLDRLDLVRVLYGSIQVPLEVAEELQRGRMQGHLVPDLTAYDWVETLPVTVPPDLQAAELDPGETESLALALLYPPARILLDDLRGREIARARGLLVTGTLGILAQAKREGHLQLVRPHLEHLIQLRFRMSVALMAQILHQVGE